MMYVPDYGPSFFIPSLLSTSVLSEEISSSFGTSIGRIGWGEPESINGCMIGIVVIKKKIIQIPE